MSKDSRTRAAIDALADLLLTGPAEVDPPLPHEATSPPKLRLAGGDDHPTLRVHDDEAAPEAVEFEAVFVGHLPGYAAPWVSQYAHVCSDRHGPTALLRYDGRRTEIELFEDGVDDEPLAIEAEAPVARALLALAPRVRCWLVLFAAPHAAAERQRCGDVGTWTLLSGADDAAIVGAYRLIKSLIGEGGAQPQRLRLMFMGCDESAAEAATARIAHAADRYLDCNVECLGARQRMEPVRRRYIGSFAAAQGGDDWATIVQTLTTLAAHDVDEPEMTGEAELTDEELLALTQTNEEADDTDLGALRFDEEGEPVRDEIERDEAETDAPAEAEAEARAPASAETDDVVMQAMDAIDGDERAMDEIADAARRSATPEATPEGPPQATIETPEPAEDEPAFEDISHIVAEAVVPSNDAPPEPAPAEQAAAPSDAPPAGPEQLAAYIAGAKTLVARCPRHESVQLAVDEWGVFHLMLFANRDAINEDIRNLVEAQKWAHEHRQLLGLSCGVSEPSTREPQIHLFTDRPKAAAELAYAGPVDRRALQLHLLKPVTVGGATVYVHEELS